MTSYWCEFAWLGGETVTSGVLLTVSGDRFTAIGTAVGHPPPGATALRGLTLPGLANAHSHAFHRALRGRTHSGGGTFWTWRDQMYAASAALTPDNYRRLARATFAEMALAGVTVVGEFHYVHHQAKGRHYANPNAMGEALVDAASDAGLRLTLLDVCYLHGGLGPEGHLPLLEEQLRFSDGTVERWAARLQVLNTTALTKVGAAIHSVRAVDPVSIRQIAELTRDARLVLHAHVSEQRAENEQCRAAYSCSPTELLAQSDAITEQFTAVHATHLTDADAGLLGATKAGVCVCPTTERDLADGICDSTALVDAGATLSVGTDSHAVIDAFEETRAIELDQRLADEVRGNHTPHALLMMATANGYRALGWHDGGVLRTGGLADFVTVDLESVRLAGTDQANMLSAAVFAAAAADLHHVVVGGKVIVRDAAHTSIDVVRELTESIYELRSFTMAPT